MRRGEFLSPGVHCGLIDSGSIRQIAQRLRCIAFQINVGLIVLVRHRHVVRRLVHYRDGGLGRAVTRRIPRYPRPHDDREIHVVPERFDVRALIERMVLGEVGEQSAGLFDHRQSELLAQRHQSFVGFDLLAGALGEHDRTLRLGEQGGELFDILRRSQQAWRGGNFARIGRRRPRIHQGFRGNRQVNWPCRLPLRHLAGADDAFIERVNAARDRTVFDDRVNQMSRAADDAEIADPLRARIELRLLAVGHRLARDHHHRNSGNERAVDTHRALQQAGTRVQQHSLQPSGGQRVARGDVDGERFVPHIQELGAALFPVNLVGHSFPDRRPFGTRRGQDVFDAELSKCFDQGFAAIELIFHV